MSEIKYNTFINILDKIRYEAPENYKTYRPDVTGDEKKDNINIEQARSKAFVHLYLKTTFGLLDFEKRNDYVTDGKYDGGIDGYYFNETDKKLYFIQAKFRANEKNFETKPISPDEIFKIDAKRIVKGEYFDLDGNEYNAKIRTLIDKWKKVNDKANYQDIKVIILANFNPNCKERLEKTVDLPVEIFDFEKTYSKLVFPVVSGTYYNQNEVIISLSARKEITFTN